ncbi:hypothetical protein XU18_2119 [Perkinsela sp. CCAP 1560/4]|nr:hypothetical protein XU18_2119 [Perkinsela sp. CCAP 1560/4]|eukprot:KNH07183.1 hypothetical protein XU18_2119 [Perkinsela sp. CCAP 1560/4]
MEILMFTRYHHLCRISTFDIFSNTSNFTGEPFQGMYPSQQREPRRSYFCRESASGPNRSHKFPKESSKCVAAKKPYLAGRRFLPPPPTNITAITLTARTDRTNQINKLFALYPENQDKVRGIFSAFLAKMYLYIGEHYRILRRNDEIFFSVLKYGILSALTRLSLNVQINIYLPLYCHTSAVQNIQLYCCTLTGQLL